VRKTWQPPSPVSREAQANKIRAILQDHLQTGLDGTKCLEIGCADGSICHFLSTDLQETFGIEFELGKLVSSPYLGDEHLFLAQADGRRLPFPGAYFDLVVLAQVYEHMTDHESLSAEVFRVLKPGGICFFSGPNRWQVIEPHYFLPFLSWLPHQCASRYLKLSGRGKTFDIHPRGYHSLKRLWSNFHVVDYTWKILKYPRKFTLDVHHGRIGLMAHMPAWVLKTLKVFYPNFNWILVKEIHDAGNANG